MSPKVACAVLVFLGSLSFFISLGSLALRTPAIIPGSVWRLNIAPLPFVFVKKGYSYSAHLKVTSSEGGEKEFSQNEILGQFSSRLDQTYFKHVVREAENLDEGFLHSILLRGFCSESLSRVLFSVTDDLEKREVRSLQVLCP